MTDTPPTRDDGWGQDEPACIRALAARVTATPGLGRVARLVVGAVLGGFAVRMEREGRA